jgi:GlcNAc-PI de-N-acetylase
MTPTQTGPLKLMGVLAHPDDESLGIGGTLAKYADEGIETYLVTATRGEPGRFGESGEKPPPDVVGRVREAELHEAARVLGVREVRFLDYYDGDLDQVNVTEAVARIADHLRRVKPYVVITFGPEGAYGHPDHIRHLAARDRRGCRRRRGKRVEPTPSRVEAVLHGVEPAEMGGLPDCAARPDLQSGWYRTKVLAMARLGPHDSDRHQSVLPDRLESCIVSQDTDEHTKASNIYPPRTTRRSGGDRSFIARSVS